MKVEYQTVPKKSNGEGNERSRHWPYLWCHMCDTIKHTALRVQPGARNLVAQGCKSIGICTDCLQLMNECVEKGPNDGL